MFSAAEHQVLMNFQNSFKYRGYKYYYPIEFLISLFLLVGIFRGFSLKKNSFEKHIMAACRNSREVRAHPRIVLTKR
jgi:predicted ABC-type sugar transport system permease subunit